MTYSMPEWHDTIADAHRSVAKLTRLNPAALPSKELRRELDSLTAGEEAIGNKMFNSYIKHVTGILVGRQE